MTKNELKEIVRDCMLTENINSNKIGFTLIEITKLVYSSLVKHGITPDDDIFYSYQYDLRWCLQELRNEGFTSFKKMGKFNVHCLCE